MKNQNIVTAHEINSYVYCKRSWWLDFNGFIDGKSPSLIYGTVAHNLLSKKINMTHQLKIILYSLLIVSLIFVSLAIIYLIFVGI